MSVLTNVPLNKQCTRRSMLFNGIEGTWFLCRYCNRAFLHLNQLLKHKTETHKDQFYSDNGIQWSGKHKLKRQGRSPSEDDSRKADSAGENDSTGQSTIESDGKADISSDDQKSMEIDHEDQLCQSMEEEDFDLVSKVTDMTQPTNEVNDSSGQPDTPTISKNSCKGMDEPSEKNADHSRELRARFKEAFKQASSIVNKCRFCSSSFPNKCSLKLHELVFHNQRKVTKLSCRYCEKISLNKTFHAVHEKTCSKKASEGCSQTSSRVLLRSK